MSKYLSIWRPTQTVLQLKECIMPPTKIDLNNFFICKSIKIEILTRENQKNIQRGNQNTYKRNNKNTYKGDNKNTYKGDNKNPHIKTRQKIENLRNEKKRKQNRGAITKEEIW